MSHEELPRVTYFNTDLDLTGINALFDAELPHFKNVMGQIVPNWINGEDSSAGAAYDVQSPIDRDMHLGKLIAASNDAVEQAVAAARRAQPAWEQMGFAERIRLLRKAADKLRAERFNIGMGVMIEVGKSRTEAMGEIEEAIDMIVAYCDQAEQNNGFALKLKSVGTETGLDVLRPYGVFAVIAPFNFPLALATSMITAALLMGNSVVFKPTENAIFSAATFVYLLRHLPPGVFNLIGGGAAVGAALTASNVDGIAFTGSRAVGMQLVQNVAAGPFMRPVIAELGGKNATFVGRSADLDMAAKATVRAAYGLSGQKCSACSKVYIARGAVRDFTAKLLEHARQITIGDPLQAENFMGPVINEAAATRYAEAINLAGADHVLLGGERLTGGVFDRGFYIPPTIVKGLGYDHELNQRELFLPFLSVLEMDDLETAIADANTSPYGLTAGLYTTDEKERDLFLNTHQAGVMYVNRPSASTTGAWPGYQGFCGWKGSGLSGKGGLGTHYLGQFGREQSQTVYW